MNIHQLKKDQVYDLLKRLIIHYNHYILNLQLSLADSNQANISMLISERNKWFIRRQINGINKMGLVTTTGLDAIEQALSYSHWALLEDLRIERPDNNTLLFGIVNCSTKRMMDKLGLNLSCNTTGVLFRETFIEAIEPKAKVYPIFTGQDINKRCSKFTCLWEVKLFL